MKKVLLLILSIVIILVPSAKTMASDFNITAVRFRSYYPGPGFSMVTTSPVSDEDIEENFGENVLINGVKMNEFRNITFAWTGLTKNFSGNDKSGWYIFHINQKINPGDIIEVEILDTFTDINGNRLGESVSFRGEYPEVFDREISLRRITHPSVEDSLSAGQDNPSNTLPYILIAFTIIAGGILVWIMLRKGKKFTALIITAVAVILIPVYIFAFLNISSPEETSEDKEDIPFTFIDPNKQPEIIKNQNIIPGLEDIKGEPGNTDVIVWYDIDIGPTTNGRPQQGWWPLNPNHPDEVEVDGHFRTTTPLLGLYDCRDPKTAYQHAYWISAMGGHAFAIDYTNYGSPRGEDAPPHMVSFWNGILKNTEVLYDTLSKIEEFQAPFAYPVMRLSGLAPGDVGTDIEEFRMQMDEVYEIYEKYPEQWYKLKDGTEREDKPFIVIFAHWFTLEEWAKGDGPDFDDPRFNIRWSNGGLLPCTVPDDEGYRRIEAHVPFWLFAEGAFHPVIEKEKMGYYMPYYKVSPDNRSIENMIAQAGILRWGEWDGMLTEVNGKITFQRNMKYVHEFKPQTVLINRFNYANAWKSQPQEGLSLNSSIHIEPNEDWGFKVFNIVTDEIYTLNDLEKNPPPKPQVVNFSSDRKIIGINLKNYPLEYRISYDQSFENESWTFLNAGKGGIEVPEDMSLDQGVYIQTRNAFGESEVKYYLP